MTVSRINPTTPRCSLAQTASARHLLVACILGGFAMFRQLVFAAVLVGVGVLAPSAEAQQPAYGPQPAYGQQWGGGNRSVDWNRFYHYPYVYYPQNFYGPEYYRSSDSLYHRYPAEMRIPVYNKRWHNEYPSPRRFHSGHHFILDVF